MERTLVVLALLVTLASATVAQTPPSSTSPLKISALESDATLIGEITVGTAARSDQNFVITLDERSIERVYQEWVRPLPGVWTPAVTKEQFKFIVCDVASRKLVAMFPNGLAPDTASKMTIEIKVKLDKSREISITIGC